MTANPWQQFIVLHSNLYFVPIIFVAAFQRTNLCFFFRLYRLCYKCIFSPSVLKLMIFSTSMVKLIIFSTSYIARALYHALIPYLFRSYIPCINSP